MGTIFTIGWQKPGRRVLLASRSPRRRDLLRRMGFSFDVVAPEVDDEGAFLDKDDIEGSLQRLAHEKTKLLTVRHPDALVLGADTIVVSDGTILGKPRDETEARAMLNRLKGSEHAVYSAVVLTCGEEDFFQSGIEKTKVFFRDIDEREIESYIATGEYVDKAGAYAIQGSAMVFVQKIDGCFYNVVGLPIIATLSLFNAYMTRKESDNV